MNREQLFLSTIDPAAPALARKYGLGLEIAEFCTAWNLDEHFSEVDPLVREKMKGLRRFTLHGPFNELFPCAIDPLARKLCAYRFRQALDTARGYGIRKVILHGGYNPRLYYPVWYTEQSPLFWEEFLPSVPEDMVICVENVLEEEPDMMASFIRKINDPRLRMCLDVGHVNAYSPVPAADWISACADLLEHFHIHNNYGDRDGHQPLDEGSLDMEALFRQIGTLCPRATATLELSDGASSLRWLCDKKII